MGLQRRFSRAPTLERCPHARTRPARCRATARPPARRTAAWRCPVLAAALCVAALALVWAVPTHVEVFRVHDAELLRRFALGAAERTNDVARDACCTCSTRCCSSIWALAIVLFALARGASPAGVRRGGRDGAGAVQRRAAQAAAGTAARRLRARVHRGRLVAEWALDGGYGAGALRRARHASSLVRRWRRRWRRCSCSPSAWRC